MKKTSRNTSRKETELQQSWDKILQAHSKPLERGAKAKGSISTKRISKELPALLQPKIVKPSPKLPVLQIPPERSSRNIPSLDTGAGIGALPPRKEYTGDQMLGVATMHKSNSVPVFNNEAAIDVAKMRR